MNTEKKGQLIILKREKVSVEIDKEKKTVDFKELEYTFDEVLQVAKEIAETFQVTPGNWMLSRRRGEVMGYPIVKILTGEYRALTILN